MKDSIKYLDKWLLGRSLYSNGYNLFPFKSVCMFRLCSCQRIKCLFESKYKFLVKAIQKLYYTDKIEATLEIV